MRLFHRFARTAALVSLAAGSPTVVSADGPPALHLAQNAAPSPPSATVAVPPATVPSPAPGPFSVSETAGGFTVQNIRFSLGPLAYWVPRADVRGTTLTKDELTRVLDPVSGIPLADRVSRLNAAEIAIPELVMESGAGTIRQSTTYRDVRLSTIGAGRVASVVSANGTYVTSEPKDSQQGSFGRTEITDADLGLALAVLNEKASGPAEELRRLYGSFSIDALTSRDAKGATVRVARMSGRDLRARRTSEGWGAAFTRFAGKHDLSGATPTERREVVTALADLFEAFEFGALEATGIEFNDPTGKDGTGRVARIGYTGGASSEFRIEGLEAGGNQGRVRLSSFSLGGFSVGPALKAAREMAGADPSTLTPSDMRRLVPTIGSLRVSGLDVEPGDKSGTITLGSIELLADKPIEAVPTELKVAVRNVVVPIGPDPDEDGLKQLKALGYDKIDGSLAANIGWNEAGQELVIRELSVRGGEMGSVVMRGVVGNVTKDVFNADAALASVALLGASAKSIDILVENGGLFERIVAREAKRQGRTGEDIRREYGMTAAIGVPIMLGGGAAAKALGQAVARFVAKPGRLSVQVKTKDPAGLGVADFAGSPDPSLLLERLDVTATAE